jgi:hypothetical protein
VIKNKKMERFEMPEIYKYDFDNNPKPWLENNR